LLVVATRAPLLCMPKKNKKYRRRTFQRHFSILACTFQSSIQVHVNKPFYFVASRCDWNWVRSRVKTLLIKHSPTWKKEMCITGTKCLAEETRVTGQSYKLTLILRRSRTGTVWFYTSTSNKRAA